MEKCETFRFTHFYFHLAFTLQLKIAEGLLPGNEPWGALVLRPHGINDFSVRETTRGER